ncbi:hypothetical protein SALBM311S_00553 [Streptomyces alboniger]
MASANPPPSDPPRAAVAAASQLPPARTRVSRPAAFTHSARDDRAESGQALVTALTGPKVLPTKVVKLPAEGCARENSASVLPNSATATPAATMVSGDATPRS